MKEDSDVALEALTDFLNAVEAGVSATRQTIKNAKRIEEEKPPTTVGGSSDGKQVLAVLEQTFTILTYEKQTGDKLGEYETATKKNNLPEKFQSAYNILKQSNATIAHRYHGKDYSYSYWIYGEDRIFRQKFRK